MATTKKRKKRSPLLILQDKIWKKFSVYIRCRDANYQGYCVCITCGKVAPWKEMDAGHWLHGKFPGTWLNPKNVHAQCPQCNKYKDGARDIYAIRLEAKYGFGILQELEDSKHKSAQTWRMDTLREAEKEVDRLSSTSFASLPVHEGCP